jgi:hypothetical protein
MLRCPWNPVRATWLAEVRLEGLSVRAGDGSARRGARSTRREVLPPGVTVFVAFRAGIAVATSWIVILVISPPAMTADPSSDHGSYAILSRWRRSALRAITA